MDVIKFLEAQHREVEGIFRKLGKKGAADKNALVDELSRKLIAHMVIEQGILYPSIKEIDVSLVHEAYEEHHVAREELTRLLDTEPDEETFDARVTTLKELIDHHVGEEEDDLFVKMRKLLSASQLQGLYQVMHMTFDRLVDQDVAELMRKADQADVLADVEKDRAKNGNVRSAQHHVNV